MKNIGKEMLAWYDLAVKLQGKPWADEQLRNMAEWIIGLRAEGKNEGARLAE